MRPVFPMHIRQIKRKYWIFKYPQYFTKTRLLIFNCIKEDNGHKIYLCLTTLEDQVDHLVRDNLFTWFRYDTVDKTMHVVEESIVINAIHTVIIIQT